MVQSNSRELNNKYMSQIMAFYEKLVKSKYTGQMDTIVTRNVRLIGVNDNPRAANGFKMPTYTYCNIKHPLSGAKLKANLPELDVSLHKQAVNVRQQFKDDLVKLKALKNCLTKLVRIGKPSDFLHTCDKYGIRHGVSDVDNMYKTAPAHALITDPLAEQLQNLKSFVVELNTVHDFLGI